MRKVLAFLVLTFLVLTLGYSQELKILTFDEAVNIALKNNKDILVAKINLDNAVFDYENKKKDPTTLILSLKQAELNVKLEQVKYNNTRIQVIQSVRNAYFSVLEAQAQVKLYKKQVEYYLENLNAVKLKFQLGNATATDVKQAEINYLSAQNMLKSAENNLAITWSQFWQTLGVSPMENITLKEPDLVVFNFTLDNLFNLAKENLTNIVQASNNVELYNLQVKLYNNEYTPKATLLSSQNSLESAKMNLEQVLNSTKLTIAQRLDQLYASLKEVELQKINLDLAKENYNITKTRFEAGLITKLDLMNAEINLIKAENNYYSSLHTYFKNLDNLSISVGKVLFEGGEVKK